jgi:hypothetical protein
VVRGGLRRYDIQARYACILSLASSVPFLGAAGLAFRNYDHVLGQIVYGAEGLFVLAFGACLLLSMIPACLGALLGWSSAGQRRNDRPARSWIGFFVGGTVLTFDLILLIAFLMLRLAKPM